MEVVAGDQDAFVRAMAQRHRGWHRMAVGAGVGGIEQLHGAQVDLAGLHGHGYALFHGQARNKEDGQGLVTEGGDGRVLLAKDGGVIGIGGNAFETV